MTFAASSLNSSTATAHPCSTPMHLDAGLCPAAGPASEQCCKQVLASLGMQPLVPLGPVQAPPASLPLAVDGVIVGHVAAELVDSLVKRLRQLKVALVARQEGWPTLPGFPLPTVGASNALACTGSASLLHLVIAIMGCRLARVTGSRLLLPACLRGDLSCSCG